MGENAKSYRGQKIIILSRDATLTRAACGCDPALQHRCLRVTSPYEAAAELLAEKPLAMVVDLRRLTPGDLPLIEMARQRGLEVLAVGSVPLGISTTDLSGVRLSARGHLSGLLTDLSTAPQPAAADAPSDLSSLARSVEKASSGAYKSPRAPDPPPRANADDEPPVSRPDQLLTREELAALLEDES